ncbi:MAG: DUF3291 domain-containing protein [Actinomycetota bacterium]|nr:DUF3291 domain-containing protein [Actinomycetota bacterium]
MSQQRVGHRHLAQLNVAVMLEPLDTPRMATFTERLAEVNAAADRAEGFVWRLQDEDGPGATSFRMLGNDMLIVNLSVWKDLASLREFVYQEAGHRDALAARRQWFERAAEPMTVCWHVDEGHLPSLAEAEAMLLRLRTDGPGAEVFPFSAR